MSAAERDPWAWLASSCGCGCGCSLLVRTAEDLKALEAAHPDWFDEPPAAGPAPHPDDEWERQIEEDRGTPMAERLHGLVPEEPWM